MNWTSPFCKYQKIHECRCGVKVDEKKCEWARPNPPVSPGENQTKKKQFLPPLGLRQSNLFLTKIFSFFFPFLEVKVCIKNQCMIV